MELERLTRRQRGPFALAVLAMAWGFAEATLFFIVPDVLLSAIAISSPRLAMVCCVFATVGALGGGLLVYTWGESDIDRVVAVMDRIPAIGPQMMQSVEGEVVEHGVSSLFLGPMRGVSYKLYAAFVGAEQLSRTSFLLVSIPARLIRFVLVSLFATVITFWVRQRFPYRLKFAIHLGVWTIFYIAYFILMPG